MDDIKIKGMVRFEYLGPHSGARVHGWTHDLVVHFVEQVDLSGQAISELRTDLEDWRESAEMACENPCGDCAGCRLAQSLMEVIDEAEEKVEANSPVFEGGTGENGG